MIAILTKSLHNALLTRTCLNLISIVAGISLWSIITGYHLYHKKVSLPLVFDNSSDTRLITAPGSVLVCLYGPRAALHESIRTGAVHIDAQQLKEGTHLLRIGQQDLLLPTAAKLVDYTPVEVIVTPL